MYCGNCGNEIIGNTPFCPFCGQKVDAVPQADVSGYGNRPVNRAAYDPVAGRQSVRQAELAEVDRMIEYFSKKSDRYAEYERLSERLDPRYLKKKKGLLIGGIAVSFVGLFFLMMGMILPGVFVLLGSGVMIFFFCYTSKSRNVNYEEAYRQFDAISNELYEHYLGYGDCLVSAEYTNPSNLGAIRGTISSGRADTIKEAVNILVDDAHRNNMEAYARQAAISADNAARGANAAAVFAAANLFLKR